MQRVITFEQFEEKINNSDYYKYKIAKQEVANMYKKVMTKWLDNLKQKLNNYKPKYKDLDLRRSISPSFNYCENDLIGEIWKTYPLNNNYSVSNFGRIKYKGRIQKQKDDKIQYCTLADESLIGDYIYKFVAYTFLDKQKGDGFQVHHVTNDGYYNTVQNLVLLTKEEHSYVHGFKIEG